MKSFPVSSHLKAIRFFGSFLSIVLFATASSAQSVGINANAAAPNSSAILDIDVSAVQGKKKGMLIPRVTEQERLQMSPLLQPAKGLLVYQTDGAEGLYYDTSLTTTAKWVYIKNGAENGWNLTGNTGTSDATNFIGTNDNVPFNIRVNGIRSGRIDHLKENVFYGYKSGISNGAGNYNTAIGSNALNLNAGGTASTAVGASAMKNMGNSVSLFGGFNSAFGAFAMEGSPVPANNTGTGNTAIGGKALNANSSGDSSTAVGYEALYSNTTGSENVALGSGALYSNTSENRVTAVGVNAMQYYKSGIENVALGYAALRGSNPGTNTGGNNTAIGSQTLNSNTTGTNNAAIGYVALATNTTGSQNTALGSQALLFNYAANNITAVGYQAMKNASYNSSANDNFSVAVGAYALRGSNTILSNTGVQNTALGAQAMMMNTAGASNVAVGNNALQANTTGINNTAIGHSSLITNSTGSSNTAIGWNADVTATNLVNATAIGYAAKVSANNSLVLGGQGANSVNVGIGVAAPIATLQVKGNLKIFNNVSNTHTGIFYNGTADVNGFELYAPAGDAYLGLQRNGQNASLNLSKKTGTGDFQAFFVNGTLVGTISTNGATTSYNTTSDYRLKENIQPSQTGLDDLMNIQVEDYNYKTDPDKALQTGFLAQELYKIFPQAVHAGGDDPKTDPWTIDYSKLTPMLVKAVQEEHTHVTSLELEINQLKKDLALSHTANSMILERLSKLEKANKQR